MRNRLFFPLFLMLLPFISLTSMSTGIDAAEDTKMIIAISATGNSLESTVSQNFGRCPYFIFFDCRQKTMTVLENPGVRQQSGAGRNAAELIINNGATHLVTGNIGDKVIDRLKEAGIEIITDLKRSMTVKEAIEMVRAGM